MNILLATLVFPYPINDGGKSGTFRMIDALRENNTITIIAPESNAQHLAELQDLWPDVNILTFKQASPPPQDGKLISFAKRIFRRKLNISKDELQKSQMQLNSYSLLGYYFQDLLDIFVGEFSKQKFDLVQIDFSDIAPLVHFIPKGIPSVFVQHEHKYYRMVFERNTLKNPSLADEWKINNTRVFEIGTINLFDKIVCLSEFDKKLLEQEGISASKVMVSPLPMELQEKQINIPFRSANQLVFLGPDQHYPNIDGVDWFLQNSWPKLLALNPSLKLLIVGKWSPEKQGWFKNYKNVEFRGFVPDLSTVLEGSIMIVPLRIGGGMRMKILEGVSYHTPIISTAIGAEGIPLEHNKSCKIADTAEDFVKHTHELLHSTEQQQSFTKNAVAALSSSFKGRDCADIREAVYQQTLEEKK